ncbi:MAG: cytochrome c [Limnobacter sp.]|nr:cytochrome c [Limnobacter sp.]
MANYPNASQPIRVLVSLALLCAASWGHAADHAALPKFPPKTTAEAGLIRGESVYKRYCVLCHGVEADGKGRAAKQYDPKPADLTRSPFPPAYKEMIIKRGGEAVGRSKFMPPWDQELTSEQVGDLLLFLESIKVN